MTTKILDRYLHLVDPKRPGAQPTRETECRLCGSAERLTRHHLIPWRYRKGREKIVSDHRNIVSLCRRCHDLVEAKQAGGGRVWRHRLRLRLTLTEVEFGRWHMGMAWFDNLYPPQIAARPEDEHAELMLVSCDPTSR